MKFKRFICLALALVLAVGALALPAAAEERAPRSYYREEQLAYALKALGLFRGVSDRDLDLDGAPERAQALVMMLRLMGLETEAAAEEGEQPFTDLDVCRWASTYIGYAFRHGLAKGRGAQFDGRGVAGARDYLTFVLRALGYEEGTDGDFLWRDPTPLARALGLLPPLVRLNDFRRADVVTVSYAALSAKCKGSDATLAQTLAAQGVLAQSALDAYYDPAAAESGKLSGRVAENVMNFAKETRAPLGIDISGLTPQYHGAVALIGDAGYELYSFYQNGAASVARQIAAGAAAVEGKARVFGIIVPNSMGAVLSYDDAARLTYTQKSEPDAIRFAYEQMGDKVVTVDALTNLRLHNDEYIFFRTDHHWTALGSYYAYQAWADAAGKEPVNLDRFDARSAQAPLGLFYGACNNPWQMEQNRDTIVAYVPHSSFTCDPAGAMDYNFAATWGYNVFLGGDRGITTIVNNDISDDSACVLVKDSYGNPFATWLTQHYHTVYVIDYRHYRNSWPCLTFSQFVEQKGVQDFIVLLPMTLSQSDTTAYYLSSYCK